MYRKRVHKKVLQALNWLRRSRKRRDYQEVYVFPLPNVVLLPGMSLPVNIFEERYRKMADDALMTNSLMAMSWGAVDENNRIHPHAVCGAGSVHVLESFPDGRKTISIEDTERYRLIKIIQKKPYIRAQAVKIPDIPIDSPLTEKQLSHELKTLAKRLVFLSAELSDHFIEYVDCFYKPHALADFIGYYFLSSAKAKQRLLETADQKQRVEYIAGYLKNRIAKLEQAGFFKLPTDSKPEFLN